MSRVSRPRMFALGASSVLAALLWTVSAFGAGEPAKRPAKTVPPPRPSPCAFGTVSQIWDFATGPQGFYLVACDIEGGAQVWQHGDTDIPDAPLQVWGTVLTGNYPDNTGSGLASPYFTVTPSSYLVQVNHYFATEYEYDGCNVEVYPDYTVIAPIEGYTVSAISPSGSYYAYCVDGEPGWTGSSGGWRSDCFDLSAYMGRTIALFFDFGSDASVTAAGWYLASVALGAPSPTGACCNAMTGACQVLMEVQCQETGGVWHPEWATCEPNPCPQPGFPCTMAMVSIDWDFSTGSQGFGQRACDSGGLPVWEYGHPAGVPNAPSNVWGTVLSGAYPNEAGSGLGSPDFVVTPSTRIVEVIHYFATEYGYDGCNLSIYPYGSVVTPIAGYTIPAISETSSYYAWCVDGEPGWTGQSGSWRIDCFDLSSFMGLTVSLSFDFGSDASATSLGWYLARVRVGGDEPPQQAACCDPWTGACTITTASNCAASGGIYHAESTSCDPNPCPPFPPACEMPIVSQDWDFAAWSQGFTPLACDGGGAQVWEYGATSIIPGAPPRVWGTILEGPYPNDSGSGLQSPSFTVTATSRMAQVLHTFDTEYGYDGANVTVHPQGTVIAPLSGYTVGAVNASTGYYAWCVDGEPGWTGSSGGWRVDCFDLSPWMGSTISLEFDFGSDASAVATGWYLARVRIGGSEVSEPLEAPSNLLAETQSASRIRLSWEDNSGREDVFVIERKAGISGEWQTVQEIPADVVVWEDPNVSEGVEYFYRVRARDQGELSIFSNFAVARCGVVPAAPTQVVATPTSPTTIRLNWVDNSANEAGFSLQRRDSEFGSWFDLPINIPADAQQVVNNGLTPNHNYAYRIRAYNGFGASQWAASGNCYTPVDPGNFGAVVVVKKGTQPIEGATVEVQHGTGQPFVPVGQTDSFGELYIPSLSLNDRIRATQVAQSWTTCRSYRAGPFSDMGMRLWIDSDARDVDANLFAYLVSTTASIINLQLIHPIFRFDLGISIEADLSLSDPYWAQLGDGCQLASNYLYDISDGQMSLRTVVIWDNKGQWEEADVRIENSVWPHSDLDNFMDCDSYTSEEHAFLSRYWSGVGPTGNDWYTTMIHELGHYILDLKDEYETGIGGQAQMEYLKSTNPSWYPKNYGFMDKQWSITEMSSTNDYKTGYDYECPLWHPMLCGLAESEQLYAKGHSTWDHVEQKLEAWSSLADIMQPPAGWFVSGSSTSADRQGPTSGGLGTTAYAINSGGSLIITDNPSPAPRPEIEVIRIDSGTGSFATDVTILDDGTPVPDARIYARSGAAASYLGKTDTRGRLAAAGLRAGDEIRAYARTLRGGRLTTTQIAQEQAGGSAVLALESRESDGGAPRSGTGPGAAVDVATSGTLSAPIVRLDLWADETLLNNPAVVGRYGSTETVVPMHLIGQNYYAGELQIDPADSTFDGRGLFEISIADLGGNPSDFTSAFVVQEATAARSLEVYAGEANLNLQAGDIGSTQIASGANSNTNPYRPTGFDLNLVGDLVALHLSEQDSWPSTAGLNIAYDDSLLGGVDETSLRIYKWNPAGLGWNPVEGSQVSTSSNVVSAPVGAGGVYCIFADAGTSDAAPPAPVEDFGAVGTAGLGAVELLWTATGDDGGSGSAEQYMIAYGDSAVTEESWNRLPAVTVAGGGHEAGSQMQAIVQLPLQGHLYHLALRAKDEASNLSSLSNPTYVVSGVADPNLVTAPPTRMRAVDRPSDQGGAVDLGWRLSRDDGAGKNTVVAYRIYRTNPPDLFPDTLALVPAGTTAATDSSARNGVDYVYWVSAVDVAAETMSEENRAFATRNIGVPVGDFSGDGIAGVNDLGLLVNTFAIDSSDVEFDPLFDLDHDMDIADGDFEVFKNAFPTSGYPSSDPAGENGAARVFSQTRSENGGWRIDLTIRGVADLAAYSFRVRYPNGSLTFLGAEPDSGGTVLNILRADGGTTPLFMVARPPGDPALINIANAIRRPSEVTSPDGDGYVASLRFSGSGIEQVVVFDFVAMDAHGGLNYRGTPSGIEDGGTILRPYLYAGSPNPFFDRTVFRFQIPTQRKVKLAVYDASGRLVRSLVDGTVAPGVHDVLWNGRNQRDRKVASGVYFLRFETQGYEKARKIVRLN